MPWVFLSCPPHTVKMTTVKAVTSFLYLLSKWLTWWQVQGQMRSEGDDQTVRGHFLPFWAHMVAVTRLLTSVWLFWVFGSHPYAPTHPVGKRGRRADAEEEGLCWVIAPSWVAGAQVLGMAVHPGVEEMQYLVGDSKALTSLKMKAGILSSAGRLDY